MNEQLELFPTIEREFFENFLFTHVAPHATQTIKQSQLRNWTFHKRPTNDKAIKKHLEGVEALGVPPRWYPIFGNLDIDNPKKQEKPVFDKLQELNITIDQYALFKTPRHSENGNSRLYVRLELHGKPITAKLYNRVLSNHFKNIEINPNGNKIDRLALGFESELIDNLNSKVIKLSLEEKLAIFKNLKPIEISNLPRFQQPEVKKIQNLESSKKRSDFVARAEALKEFGLQKNSEPRHLAQSMVLFLLWLRDEHNEISAAEFVKNWIRAKHNGFSELVNKGDWQKVDKEIDRQAESIFAEVADKFPDRTHNLVTAATKDDVLMAANFGKGSATLQKRFFNLLKIIRPNFFKYDWIYIPAHTWRDEIASRNSYKEFQRELEAKGLMITDNRYRIGVESRKYKFNLQLDSGAALQKEGRNIDSYYEALETGFNGELNAIESVTGINRMTLWRRFQKQN
jgi:hypothetical protein